LRPRIPRAELGLSFSGERENKLPVRLAVSAKVFNTRSVLIAA